MTLGIIGKGFVGSTLMRDWPADYVYDSKNIESIAGCEFDMLVCAGAPAEKWKANNYPEDDLASLNRLLSALADGVQARTFVLISTIDVMSHTLGGKYGEHRLMFENQVKHLFPHAQIVRLPALFGAGLKKNALYDLLMENALAPHVVASSYQWYPISRLRNDIGNMLMVGLGELDLFPPSIPMITIMKAFFPNAARRVYVPNRFAPEPANYNFPPSPEFYRTEFYLSRECVLGHMAEFIAQERTTA